MEPTLADRLAAVDSAIADAVREAGGAPPTRIVVTKFQPASLVRELADLGVRDIGENRHQEAVVKAAEVDDARLAWHFVGQLQSNKAKAVRRYASTVHSVDRASLVDALTVDDGTDVGVFLEIGLSDEPGRAGVAPDDIDRLAERVLAAPGLRLLGVMGVAPLGAEPRQAFARLREVGAQLRRLEPAATAISAGMSGDFREAILEGATHLRIGTAITGFRPFPG
ncbi:MAG: YggS family pyridoxal phosphate-dependent enzyme [Pseudolysinimonas sp.]|uniref:YggS family pyridoxal phosphate-dependent enzyme n=1 Tax=Pseudolysinimonas sp. TaxID=2680009 RepID=UPI003C74D9FB